MLRDGEEIELRATPALTEQTDALGNVVKIGVIGVVNNEEMGQPRLITYSPLQALGEAVDETGHIIARTGQFLQRFVGETPWAHLDIAGTGMASPSSDISDTWASGFGVRLLDRLVADHYEK